MNEILKKLSLMGIVPVVKIDDAVDAVPLAKALCEGGLPCAEVTFRTAAAKEAIKNMTTEFPEMLVGAGTVLTTKQVDDAVDAGAKFIVSPGLNPEVVKYCIERNIPVTPGCSNPSDVELALSLGLEIVKFFPAEACGGLPMIKAMSAPYTNVKFMPTGGINASNICEYLSFPKIIACGGSWMVKDSLIKAGKFDEITRLTREAVNTMLGFEVRHVGMNIDTKDKAAGMAADFKNIFGFERSDAPGQVGFFCGSGIELVFDDSVKRGAKGHIAVATNSVDRAMFHLGLKGITFNMDTARYTEAGNCRFVYINGDFDGFEIHLSQK